MANRLAEILIVKDSREQLGWNFNPEEKKPGKVRITGSVVECIDAGDYSIKGLEHIIRIEKKAGFKELFGNMCSKENKERFEREMERLKDIPHKYLLIETTLSEDILSLSIPQFRQGPPAKRVLEWTIELQQRYGIVPMFVGECGERVAKTIFRNIARLYL